MKVGQIISASKYKHEWYAVHTQCLTINQQVNRMKISKIDKKVEMSKFSKWTRILIAVNIIPLYRRIGEETRFSWFSFRTLLFLIGSYFPIGVITISLFIQSDFLSEYLNKICTVYLKFEVIVIVVSIIFLFLSSPIQVLCLCRLFSQLQEISMANSLKFLSKRDLLEVISANIIAAGFMAFVYAHYMEVCNVLDNITPGRCFVNVFLMPFAMIWYSVFFVVISYFMVLVWLQHIEEIFKRKNVVNKLKWADHCTKIYKKLEHNLGPYFFVYFTQSQIIWTILLFLAISLAISNNGFSTTSLLMHSLGMSNNY